MELVGECEFFLHDLVGEEQGRGKECSVGGREATGRGGGAGGGGASVGLDEDILHIFSTQATRTQGPLADRSR